MKTLSVAVCGIEVDGKFALIKFKRNDLAGYWGLPGGKFDDDEFLPDAAKREMAEEIEHTVAFERYLATVDELVVETDGEISKRCILYVCTVTPTESVSTEPIDKEEGTIGWFTRDEIEAMRADTSSQITGFCTTSYWVVRPVTMLLCSLRPKPPRDSIGSSVFRIWYSAHKGK